MNDAAGALLVDSRRGCFPFVNSAAADEITRLVWRGIALAAVAEREVLTMVDRLHRLGAQIAKHTAVAKPHLLNQSFSCCSQAWRSLPGRKIARWALAQARHNNDTGRIRCQSDSFNRRRPPINIRC